MSFDFLSTIFAKSSMFITEQFKNKIFGFRCDWNIIRELKSLFVLNYLLISLLLVLGVKRRLAHLIILQSSRRELLQLTTSQLDNHSLYCKKLQEQYNQEFQQQNIISSFFYFLFQSHLEIHFVFKLIFFETRRDY